MILAGIVGVGKTTCIKQLCHTLQKHGYQILHFDGDDVSFRTTVKENTQFFVEHVQENGITKPFLFVDEVQKAPEIFDALKLYYDKLDAPFIVSGSNPAYLRTEANDRLQRRAGIKTLFPLSLSEICLHRQMITEFNPSWFLNLIWKFDKFEDVLLPEQAVSADILQETTRYLTIGGLPQTISSLDINKSFESIKLVAERGITETYHTTVAVDDEIRQDLAYQNSREFSYQGAHQRLRSSKRQVVDRVITHLMNHGYIFKKRPYLGKYEGKKSTYFSCYSWVDPGLVAYYTADLTPSLQEQGFRLEAYVHTQILAYLEQIPLKTSLHYYKPFSIKPSNKALDFKKGEIDFVVLIGKRTIPIEVKLTSKIASIDTTLIQQYVKEQQSPYGVVLYGGSPFKDPKRRLIFYPYWLV